MIACKHRKLFKILHPIIIKKNFLCSSKFTLKKNIRILVIWKKVDLIFTRKQADITLYKGNEA